MTNVRLCVLFFIHLVRSFSCLSLSRLIDARFSCCKCIVHSLSICVLRAKVCLRLAKLNVRFSYARLGLEVHFERPVGAVDDDDWLCFLSICLSTLIEKRYVRQLVNWLKLKPLRMYVHTHTHTNRNTLKCLNGKRNEQLAKGRWKRGVGAAAVWSLLAFSLLAWSSLSTPLLRPRYEKKEPRSGNLLLNYSLLGKQGMNTKQSEMQIL